MLDPPGVLHLLARYPKAHEIVPLLIDLGADKEIRDEVRCASICSEILISSCQNLWRNWRWHRLDVSLQDGNTPLHSFVAANMLQAAAELLARGVSINNVNSRQESPLHVAARRDLEDMTALLLAYGADEHLQVGALISQGLYRGQGSGILTSDYHLAPICVNPNVLFLFSFCRMLRVKGLWS